MARSYKSIYSALLANLFIAITKFVAGGISNSSAMISEAIHSLVDTINEILLLFGIKQSKKPPDDKRPFGYGRELFFWSFIVSILIFGLGGGISIYQGVIHILHPEPLGDPTWNYVVLVASLFFEGISFLIAAREFNKVREDLSWWQAIKESKDPSLFVVLFEDGAAVLGLFLVLICVFLGHTFHNIYLDGVGSLLVGLILVCTSAVLARESQSLLMGEGIKKTTRLRIRSIIESHSGANLEKLYSIYLGPEEVLVILSVKFNISENAEQLAESIDDIRGKIMNEYKVIRHVIIEPSFIHNG
jgi:cation diffusion facilitator family transporter